MKRLISRKNYGTLYHFTNMFNLISILLEDSLSADLGAYDVVCLTRNKNFLKQKRGLLSSPECRISINGTLLSDNYKIYPFSDETFVNDFTEDGHEDKSLYFKNYEQEERVDQTISPITPYIEEITIFKNLIDINKIYDMIIEKDDIRIRVPNNVDQLIKILYKIFPNIQFNIE